jgi:hypothetical protein
MADIGMQKGNSVDFTVTIEFGNMTSDSNGGDGSMASVVVLSWMRAQTKTSNVHFCIHRRPIASATLQLLPLEGSARQQQSTDRVRCQMRRQHSDGLTRSQS